MGVYSWSSLHSKDVDFNAFFSSFFFHQTVEAFCCCSCCRCCRFSKASLALCSLGEMAGTTEPFTSAAGRNPTCGLNRAILASYSDESAKEKK